MPASRWRRPVADRQRCRCAAGFGETIRDTVAERLAEPLYQRLSAELPVPDAGGLALVAWWD